MNFASIEFLIWAVVFIAINRITTNKQRPYVLVVFGLSFLFYKAPLAGVVILAESLLCYWLNVKSKTIKWPLVVLSISFIFIAFLLCKFYATKDLIILPLGISYFTFRLIHYLQESYRQRLREHSFIEFMAYITFFPTYMAGPINPFPVFLTNLRRNQWDKSKFSYGLERMIYGYAQLVILGNFATNYLIKNWIAANITADQTFASMSIHAVHMWLDLYIRFSAYSSIAIGISAMTGFDILENFNYPFLASNIREFWQRWHISLTNWCRDYIFTPIAAITRKPFIAIAATMITIGIWHELSFRYILWGVYHALGIIVYEKYSILTKGKMPENKTFLKIQKVTGIAFTLFFVVMSFPVTSYINNILTNLLK